MDSRRNKLLALALVAMLAASASLAWIGRDEERIAVDRTLFTVAETEKINKVSMVRAADSVELVFDGTGWSVNGAWDADLQMIKVLMATIMQAEPHRPVAASRVDTVNSQLDQRGTLVTLSITDAPQKVFTAGGNAGKSEAWFRNNSDRRPYVMIIPGYRVYVSGIFELPASGWREKRVFDLNWRNFKSLTASYPKEPAAGFVAEMKQRAPGIRGLAAVDTTKLSDYLDAVSLLMARRFVAPGVADSIIRRGPVARVEVRDIADRAYGLDLFAPGKNDEEVYGRLDNGEIVAFDRSDIPAIVRRKAWFVAAKQ